jgi:hypothetical protein
MSIIVHVHDDAHVWVESEHPRKGAGAGGGQFTKGAGGGASFRKTELSGEHAPSVGQTIHVFRAASDTPQGLEGRDAGNAMGVAQHMARLDDIDAPQPKTVKSGGPTMIHVYEVTPRIGVGGYQALIGGRSGGEPGEEGIGYTTKSGAAAMSFGKGGYDAKPVLSFPISEVRAELAKMPQLEGSTSFDDAGWRLGAEAIHRVAERYLAKQQGAKGGATFASPNVHELPPMTATHAIVTAQAQLQMRRQKLFEQAAADVDKQLGIASQERPAIGAWQDGAEATTMMVAPDATPEQLRLSAAMKGWLGQQKAVLSFAVNPKGKGFLYTADAKGSLDDIHRRLLSQGLENHTLVPTASGATIYIADPDGSAAEHVAKYAKAYPTKVTAYQGDAEFIGATNYEGTTDAEQRAEGRQAYEAVLAAGDRTGADVWRGIRDRWAETLQSTQDRRRIIHVHVGDQEVFVEAEHPRKARGPGGGEFARKGTGVTGSSAPIHVHFPEHGGHVVHVAPPVAPKPKRQPKSFEVQIAERSGIDPADVHKLGKLDLMKRPKIKSGTRRVGDVAKEIVALGQDWLKAHGVASGRIDAKTATPELNAALAEVIAEETEDALKGHDNAAKWYTRKFEEAIRVASLVHPEIATDKNARSTFAVALAVTSQGEVVGRNMELADWVYCHFKDDAQFGAEIKQLASKGGKWGSKKGAAMVSNLGKYDGLVKAAGGDLDKVTRFLSTPTTFRELEKLGYKKPTGVPIDMPVYGSAIFGPKIGQGFYQNLMGNFEPVTQDLWFMRTFGRLAGTLTDVVKTEKGRQETFDRFTSALAERGEHVPKSQAGIENLARRIYAQHEQDYGALRHEYDTGALIKDEIVASAERLTHMLDGVQENPGSGADRAWRAQIVNKARELLKAKGIDITNADLQASIWYPEKDLYEHLGSKGPRGGNDDYSKAAQRLARKHGRADDDIREALGRDLDPDAGTAWSGEVGGEDDEDAEPERDDAGGPRSARSADERGGVPGRRQGRDGMAGRARPIRGLIGDDMHVWQESDHPRGQPKNKGEFAHTSSSGAPTGGSHQHIHVHEDEHGANEHGEPLKHPPKQAPHQAAQPQQRAGQAPQAGQPGRLEWLIAQNQAKRATFAKSVEAASGVLSSQGFNAEPVPAKARVWIGADDTPPRDPQRVLAAARVYGSAVERLEQAGIGGLAKVVSALPVSFSSLTRIDPNTGERVLDTSTTMETVSGGRPEDQFIVINANSQPSTSFGVHARSPALVVELAKSTQPPEKLAELEMRGAAIHEFGHVLDNMNDRMMTASLTNTFKRFLGDDWQTKASNWMGANVSGYASTMPEEATAESFYLMATRGGPDALPRELRDWGRFWWESAKSGEPIPYGKVVEEFA